MQEVVWNYGAGVACRNSFSPRNEKFLWYVKSEKRYTFNLDDVRDPDVKYPNQKKEGKLRCNPNGKNPSDVWTIPKVTSGEKRASSERTLHPAQFPSAVIERVVLASSDPGDLILDPFMGWGDGGRCDQTRAECGRFRDTRGLLRDCCGAASPRQAPTRARRRSSARPIEAARAGAEAQTMARVLRLEHLLNLPHLSILITWFCLHKR